MRKAHFFGSLCNLVGGISVVRLVVGVEYVDAVTYTSEEDGTSLGKRYGASKHTLQKMISREIFRTRKHF